MPPQPRTNPVEENVVSPAYSVPLTTNFAPSAILIETPSSIYNVFKNGTVKSSSIKYGLQIDSKFSDEAVKSCDDNLEATKVCSRETDESQEIRSLNPSSERYTFFIPPFESLV